MKTKEMVEKIEEMIGSYKDRASWLSDTVYVAVSARADSRVVTVNCDFKTGLKIVIIGEHVDVSVRVDNLTLASNALKKVLRKVVKNLISSRDMGFIRASRAQLQNVLFALSV